jgi:hypothetical protein
VHRHQAHPLFLFKGAEDLLRLALAKHTVIHKDAGQLRANGAVDQASHHGRIDAAREPQHNALEALTVNLLADEGFQAL